MSEEVLGVASNWNVRGIPEAVRKAFADQAHAEGITIGELLTRVAFGAVPPRHAATPSPVDADKLLKLIQAAQQIEATTLPAGLKGSVRGLVRDEIRAMRKAQRELSAQIGQLKLPRK